MSKFEELQERPGFSEDWEAVARAVAQAVGRTRASDNNDKGSIDVEVVLTGLMVVAAGIIAADVNLTTHAELEAQARSFGEMMRDMAVTDREAGEAGEAQFLQILGVSVAAEKPAGRAH